MVVELLCFGVRLLEDYFSLVGCWLARGVVNSLVWSGWLDFLPLLTTADVTGGVFGVVTLIWIYLTGTRVIALVMTGLASSFAKGGDWVSIGGLIVGKDYSVTSKNPSVSSGAFIFYSVFLGK